MRAEAEKIHSDQTNHDATVDKTWAEVDVKAPFDASHPGTKRHDRRYRRHRSRPVHPRRLDDPRRLGERLRGGFAGSRSDSARRAAAGRSKSKPIRGPPLPGTFDTIGQIINPNEHKAPIIGWVSNPDNSLRAGQFITATIELPSSDDEVAIPRTALIDEGTRSMVFVATR